jgi:murein DD-endopeptidase MepM/ murein hydrolase activator NlpD
VTPDGQVALWHRDCWDLRDVPLPVAAAPTAPVSRPPRSLRIMRALAGALSRLRPGSLSGARSRGRIGAAAGARFGALARSLFRALSVALARTRVAAAAGARLGVAAAVRFGAAAGVRLRPLVSTRRRIAMTALSGVAAASMLALVIWLWPLRPDAGPPLSLASREPLAIHSARPSREDPPPRRDRTVRPIGEAAEIPAVDGMPLDELYPSLKDWVHPVTASAEYMPTFPGRLFGAERHGVMRTECGAGHCGVDLDGPRGRPIVAVAAGTVIHVDRSERGGDGRSGRYVRIQHVDGTFTAYMHMDEVAEGLAPGTAIARGQYVGTLGATAVYAAPPHLHFSLEVPNHGDRGGTHYVNPAPFLLRSTIVPVIERPDRPALN